MGVLVTLNGVDVTDAVAGFSTQRRVNAVGVCSLSLEDPAGTLRPRPFWPLVITVDSVAVFTGRVARVGCSLMPDDTGRLWGVQARNANARAQRVTLNTVIPAGTLKEALEAVAANFAAVGVTVDAAMADGPDLPELGVAWQTGEQFLNTLSTLTGWPWEIDDTDLELRMWAVGTRTAPATFSAANSNIEGPPGNSLITWTEENLDYRNSQWVIFGGSAPPDATKTDRFEGDGTTRVFTPRYWVRTRPSQVYDVQAAAYRNVGIKGVDTLFEWVWDEDNARLEQLTEAPPGTPHAALTAGQFVDITYVWLTPQAVYVQDDDEIADKAAGADTGVYGAVETRDDITDIDAATAWGLARIRQTIATPQELTILTTTVGNDPGEVVTVTVTETDTSGTHLIESEQIAYEPLPAASPGDAPYRLNVRLAVVGGTEHRENEIEFWKRVLGLGGSSGGSAVAIGGSGSSGSGLPSTDRYAFHLGGSALVDVTHSTWVDVPNYFDWVCPVDGTYRLRVEVWTLDGGTSVTPRLYDLTASSAAVVGSASTSTTRAEQTLTVLGVAGHRYRLQLLPGNSAAGVLGIGSIEVEASGLSSGGGGSVTAAWPVGSVYVSTVATNPASTLGFGTWEAFAAGRVLVGVDAGDADFDTVLETGGSKTV